MAVGSCGWQAVLVLISDVAAIADNLAGVRRSTSGGLTQWRYHGRLVARQLDDDQVVIRSGFDERDVLLRQFPGTFSVPQRFTRHMMVVADLTSADPDAVEDAIVAAWDLQRAAD